MKSGLLVLGGYTVGQSATVEDATSTNPIAKVVELISGLQAKIIAEGGESQKAYSTFSEWCQDRSREFSFELRTATGQIEDLQASIDKFTADSQAQSARIEELGSSQAEASQELEDATHIREEEAKAFATAQADLLETIDMLQRAIVILQKEMSGGSSMLQIQSAQTLTQALAAMVRASSLNTRDASKLTALLQQKTGDDDSDDDDDDDDEADSESPAVAAYEGKSGAVAQTLESLLDDAQSELNEARSEETAARHNYDLKKQSLEDSLGYGASDLAAAKKNIAAGQEKRAIAQGDLDVTKSDLEGSHENLAELKKDCMGRAEEFEEETNSRGEELKALAVAKKVVSASTGSATVQTYGPEEDSDEDNSSVFLQLKQSDTGSAADSLPPSRQALRVVRHLAHARRSSEMAQLAVRMASAIKTGGDDGPFDKVRGLIEDMLDKLQDSAAEDATKQAYCDKETKQAMEKQEDAETDHESLTTKIEDLNAQSGKLKQEIKTLEQELGVLTREKAQMDQSRQAEKDLFHKSKPELEQGIKGVQTALKVLREYYAKADDASHETSGGAGGIIGLLEVVESDFSKNLAEIVTAEERAVREYEAESKDNAMVKDLKEADAKFKTKEAASLDKTSSELSQDKDGVGEQLDSVEKYLKVLEKQCVGQADSHEKRTADRDAELAGLRDALRILGGDSAASSLLQIRRDRHLRGRPAKVIAIAA